MRYSSTIVSLVGMLALTACSQAQPTAAPAPGGVVTVAQTSADALVADSFEAGSKNAMITIGTPSDAGFGGAKAFELLAVQHRWVVDDIFQYTANLKVWDGNAYVDFATPLDTVIPRKGATPKTSAVFTNLKQGKKYLVSLAAQGNNGGTDATTVLNADTSTTAVFDFTAAQDVQDTLSTTMTVVLDQMPFNGTGTGTVATPDEGTFQNPTEAEAGTAQ